MFGEQDSFQLILHSGNARSLANEAISLIKAGQTNQAKEKLKTAHQELILAQKKHAEMLRNMANNSDLIVNLLVVHAEDHVSGSQGAFELAREVIDIYERFG